jgi:putative transposase
MPRRKQSAIPDALLDQLLDGADPRSAFNPDGVLDALKKALAERMLNDEMDQHLGGEAVDGRPNTRNGYGQKTVLTDTGRLATFPRSARHLRPAVDRQVSAPLPRLRREDRSSLSC